MRKILFTIVLTMFLSCSNVTSRDKAILNTYPIKNSNEIEKLVVKGKLDLRNNEINLYHIENLIVENIPKILVDINYEKGTSDSFIINNTVGDKVILALNNIGKDKTIKKEIIVARLPKESTLEFKLENEYKVIDNTFFEIITVMKNEYKWIKLVPYFLDEDTFEEKAKEVIEKELNPAYYENNVIIEFNNQKTINKAVYRNSEARLGNVRVIKGLGEPKAEITLEFDTFKIFTSVNDEGKWEAMIPDPYIGNLKIVQKNIVEGKIIYTESNVHLDKRNEE
ncbi:hypothetical protein [Streptobacillus moniliformis]|uniref:hypothetical protein n=1 Tax=Streptobacillus moniliformis TaxID=34105 RepID=UPI0007E2F6ED|nr:hypothetical protein [Streptobacillus moniliformis]